MTGWAANYGMTYPVLADAGANVYWANWSHGYTPAQMLIAPGGAVITKDFVQDSEIESVLPL